MTTGRSAIHDEDEIAQTEKRWEKGQGKSGIGSADGIATARGAGATTRMTANIDRIALDEIVTGRITAVMRRNHTDTSIVKRVPVASTGRGAHPRGPVKGRHRQHEVGTNLHDIATGLDPDPDRDTVLQNTGGNTIARNGHDKAENQTPTPIRLKLSWALSHPLLRPSFALVAGALTKPIPWAWTRASPQPTIPPSTYTSTRTWRTTGATRLRHSATANGGSSRAPSD